jgi:hypothetical protein
MKRILTALLLLASTYAQAANFTAPRFRAQTSSGAAIAGAKLYAYECGTTTLKTTYSDSALSVANANPLTADADGWFGEIWLTAACYKVVLKTAALATVWTADNYYPARSEIAGTLIATSVDATAALAATNSSSGAAITATNSGSGYGIVAQGGTGKEALAATGGAGADGITVTGGTTSGDGITATGGVPNGRGGVFVGSGSGTGVHATASTGAAGVFVGGTGAQTLTSSGGTNSGTAVYGTGGTPDGNAGVFEASGTGYGIYASSPSGYAAYLSPDSTSPVRASLHLGLQDAAPSSAAASDVYYNSTLGAAFVHVGSGWTQMGITQGDLTASCTAGQLKLDTGGATKELCYCQATDTWYCIAVTDTTGPAD